MKANSHVKAAIMRVVNNQLRANNPPETRMTLDRLMREGHSEQEAKELIGCVIASEMFDIMKDQKPFDLERYRAALARLPRLPGDAGDE